MADEPSLTPFLEKALAGAARLAEGGTQQCFRASDLSHVLWPDSPAWTRLSNNGTGGSTRGQGIKRAAGAPLRRLYDARLVAYCTQTHLGQDWSCTGYVLTKAGVERAQRGAGVAESR